MLSTIDKKIVDNLTTSGKLSPEQVKDLDAKVSGGEVFEEVLLGLGVISEVDLLKLKSELIMIPYINLRENKIPVEVLNTIPVDVARNYEMIAFEKDVTTLKVGLINPFNIQAVESLEFLGKQSGLKPEVYLISRSDFEHAVKAYHTLGQEVASIVEDTVDKNADVSEKPMEFSEENITSAPVSKVVSVIIRHAVELGASDIHIEPESENSQVRYRIDGVLHTSLNLPLYMHAPVISRIKVLAKLKIDETRVPQDGRIRLKIDERKVDLRVSTLPLLEHEKVTMRILDTSVKIPTIDELGFTGSMKEKIEKNIQKPFGIVLVTGPTGSGKTTTLYTLINKINTPDLNITTLEDPIEYQIDGVNQSQIQPRIKYTFANGLRSLLRQDPDIIMVGEIRDNETAEMAIHAGLTGHLLFSTLHTNNSFGAIPRLLDMKVEPFLLASTLNAIIAQRLVRRICDSCKEETMLDETKVTEIRNALATVDASELPEGVVLNSNFKVYHGKGCEECGGIGYKGRTSIGELLEMTDELKSVLDGGFEEAAVTQEAQRQKMISMQQAGFIKVLAGLTTFEEVLRVTREDS